MLDELAYAGREHLDATYVAAYDRKARFDPAEDLAALHGLGLDGSSTLVDIGAGTGGFALVAAQSFGHVTAVDVSPAMIEFQRHRVAELGLSNIDCVVAGFLTYDHAGPPADGVYTRNALHQLPDFWKVVALERIAQILRPRGVLRVRDLIYDFPPSQADEFLGRWLDGAVDDPSIGYTLEELAAHIRTEHSTFRCLFEPILAAAGFDIIASDFRRSVYGTYTCIRSESVPP